MIRDLDPLNDPANEPDVLLECEQCGTTIAVRSARDYWPLCATCDEHEAERRYESWLSDYYGGSQPTTVQEQYEAAAAQKRQQR